MYLPDGTLAPSNDIVFVTWCQGHLPEFYKNGALTETPLQMFLDLNGGDVEK